jgi:hypothetical protein
VSVGKSAAVAVKSSVYGHVVGIGNVNYGEAGKILWVTETCLERTVIFIGIELT